MIIKEEMSTSAMPTITTLPSIPQELTSETLYNKYKEELSPFINLLEKKFGQTSFALADVARIITYFSIDLVPKMMSDVGKISSLSGLEKKEFIISTVKFILVKIFQELDETAGDLPVFLEEAILIAVNPTINVLIDVENDKIVFNQELLTRGEKLKKFFCCAK